MEDLIIINFPFSAYVHRQVTDHRQKPAAPGPQTTSRTLPFADLSLHIQTLLTSLESSSEPVIILVYDEAPLRTDVANRSLVGAALQKLKVNTSRWKKVPQDGGFFRYISAHPCNLHSYLAF